MRFESYDVGACYDEMFEAAGKPRKGAALLAQRLASASMDELVFRQKAAERALLNRGITFNVYGSDDGADKIFPFDIVPRILEAEEWAVVERGVTQRILALNAFVADVYGEQRILNEGVIPREVVLSSKGYLPACKGLRPPKGIWCHVSGIDLVRDKDGRFYVLEDNLRCPSGVSYVLENRQVMKRTFPQVFDASRVRPVEVYSGRLLKMLQGLSNVASPTVVVLTPGPYNSAYFEHSFLAQQMGVELVEGRDLVVKDARLHMRTTQGLERVDVVYRRIDDVSLDPQVFQPDSLLGVPGIIEAYRAGNLGLANAPGTGVADDKATYVHVPDMIKFYLGEDPILPNVPTYKCSEPSERAHVLEHLGDLVVKAVNESGGYGMLVGPQATAAEREEFKARILERPRDYIAQPTLTLSRVPTLVDGALEGRHVDLRPYALYGEDGVFVLPGGLTRVALRRGSLVVNSSQGGGSKDTWVLYPKNGNGNGAHG
jgi:uncharacterized circularly permuted ATP-grasp superfamily protein